MLLMLFRVFLLRSGICHTRVNMLLEMRLLYMGVNTSV